MGTSAGLSFSRGRLIALMLLGVIFRVLLEFQLIQTFINPFLASFAFYEFVVLTRKWITYPNGGYLVYCIVLFIVITLIIIYKLVYLNNQLSEFYNINKKRSYQLPMGAGD